MLIDDYFKFDQFSRVRGSNCHLYSQWLQNTLKCILTRYFNNRANVDSLLYEITIVLRNYILIIKLTELIL